MRRQQRFQRAPPQCRLGLPARAPAKGAARVTPARAGGSWLALAALLVASAVSWVGHVHTSLPFPPPPPPVAHLVVVSLVVHDVTRTARDHRGLACPLWCHARDVCDAAGSAIGRKLILWCVLPRRTTQQSGIAFGIAGSSDGGDPPRLALLLSDAFMQARGGVAHHRSRAAPVEVRGEGGWVRRPGLVSRGACGSGLACGVRHGSAGCKEGVPAHVAVLPRAHVVLDGL